MSLRILILSTAIALGGLTSLLWAQSSLDPYFFGQKRAPESLEARRNALLQQQEALRRHHSELQNELRSEQQRVTLYLTLLDHILTIQQALSTNTNIDRAQRLTSTRQYLYHNSFSADEWRALVQDHRVWVNNYFARVEELSSRSSSWPAGRSRAEWQALARQEMAAARQRYYERMAQGGDPTPELRAASQVLAWAQGFATLSGSQDYFTPVPQRAANLVAQVPR